MEKALEMNQKDHKLISEKYPDKEVIFTECGWATMSNNKGMSSAQANEEYQVKYIESLWKWAKSEDIQVFIFEAFDEPWKGSDDSSEPEKHWGIYNVDRTRKLAWGRA